MWHFDGMYHTILIHTIHYTNTYHVHTYHHVYIYIPSCIHIHTIMYTYTYHIHTYHHVYKYIPYSYHFDSMYQNILPFGLDAKPIQVKVSETKTVLKVHWVLDDWQKFLSDILAANFWVETVVDGGQLRPSEAAPINFESWVE